MKAKRSQTLGLVILAAALVANGFISYQTARKVQEAFREADRARRGLTLSERVLDALRDAEIAERGFLLTGREEYLKSYTAAAHEVLPDVRELEEAVSRESSQAQRLREMQELLPAGLQAMTAAIDLRRSAGMERALAELQTGREQDLMARIREISREVEAQESSRLSMAVQHRQERTEQARLVAIIGSLLLAILVICCIAVLKASEAQTMKLSEELGRAKDALETTLYSIGDAVIVTDSLGKLTFINRAACELTGCHESGIRGTSLEELFQTVDEYSGSVVEDPVARVIRTGTTAALSGHTLLVTTDGRRIPADVSAAPILHAGRMIGVVLVFRDVSGRRRAEKDAAYLAAIVKSSDDAVVGMSLDGTIQSWNGAAERIYGYRADEIIGHSINEVVPPERQQEERDILERIRSGVGVEHFETVRVRKDGSRIDVSLTISPIRDGEGRIVGASKMARDISERKRNEAKEEEARKLETLGVLAGGIAHDFNNLLTGIMGNATLALDELGPASPASGRIRDVVTASEKAARLTRQMLAYSGKGRMLVEPINLTARIRTLLPLIEASLPYGVALTVDLEDSLPAIEADPNQIQQVITNVVVNAAEAIPEGQPGTVAISTRRQEVDEQYLRTHGGTTVGELEPGSYVTFQVADTGTGMDEATKNKMFDPFFTTKFTGRGLGLAAVYGIVQAQGGSIKVSSSPGAGTVFRVFFRAAKTRGNSGAIAGRGTILVVDEDEAARKTAQQALEDFDCRVLLADNEARAMELFGREADRIQCVVLDLTRATAEATLARMHSVRPDMPIIVSSGFTEAEAARRFDGREVAGFLRKPYQAGDLAGMVSEVVGKLSRK